MWENCQHFSEEAKKEIHGTKASMQSVVQRHGGPGCRVERSRNLIVRGFYQRLLQAQQSRIIGELSASTRQWTGSLMANNASCGILFSVEGSGKGLCNIVQMDTGPFQDVQLQEVMATLTEI